MNRNELFRVLDALEAPLPDLEFYVSQKQKQKVSTPCTLVYLWDKDNKPIYKNEFDPSLKDHFVGFLVGDTIFYTQKFRCALAQGKPLHLINGEDLNRMMPQAKFLSNAFLLTENAETEAYSKPMDWYKTVEILLSRHVYMYDLMDMGAYITPDEAGKCVIYYPGGDTFYNQDEVELMNTDFVVCSPKI